MHWAIRYINNARFLDARQREKKDLEIEINTVCSSYKGRRGRKERPPVTCVEEHLFGIEQKKKKVKVREYEDSFTDEEENRRVW